MSGIGPGGEPGDDVELTEEAADNLIGVSRGTEPVELRHHLGERLLYIRNRPLRVELALLLEAALTLDEFFAVEVGAGMENWSAQRAGVAQET